MDTKENIKDKIRDALSRQGSYSESLEILIDSAAETCYLKSMAFRDAKKAKSSFYEEITREGNTRLVMHPAVKAYNMYKASLNKDLRDLGLTLSALSVADDDELETLIDDVESVE